jgi:fatty acid desaturase
MIVGDMLIGASFGWWVPKHSAHHAHPNEIGRDPDAGEGLVASPSGKFARLLARWQAELFLPLMVLRAPGIHFAGARRLLRRRDREAAVEAMLIVAHATLYLTAVFWVLSPLRAVVFIAVQQGLFGLYIRVCFAPNHKGMPIIEPDARLPFVERQVITSRNVVGGRLMAFALGGLNYQIEHHLFPTMRRANLPLAQSLVRPFCLISGLDYREDRVSDAYREAFSSLRGGTDERVGPA